MRIKQIKNLNNSYSVPIQVSVAETFMQRFLGLMGKKAIDPSSGLLFIHNKSSRIDASIHMLFMRFDIAVFWLDETKKIIDRVIAKKWRLSYTPSQPARYVLETHPDRFNDYQVLDVVEFE